jgi:hypothetical protein
MLKDEFSRLMSLFAEAGEGKPVNLEWLFAETFTFFEHLNLQLKNGTPDEKTDALRMMNEMHAELTRETKRICERSGLSEEQLEVSSENPSNYSPEQWKLIQEAKAKMGTAGLALMDSVKDLNIPKTPGTKTLLPEPEAPKKQAPPKKTKKSNWMRS